MRNPLHKRIPREFVGEISKYIVIFAFMVLTIGLVSGFLVADNSMMIAYDNSFEKYNVEDGKFELVEQASSKMISDLEKEDVKIYNNFYYDQVIDFNQDEKKDATIRVFENRTEINKVCLMSGKMPQNEDEIAIDRMFADNNGLEVGDVITVGNTDLTISGLIALSDYSTLFSNNSDTMFDAVKFGAGIMTKEGFSSFKEKGIHYNYSWLYDKEPKDEEAEIKRSDDFIEVLAGTGLLENCVPRYANKAIQFTGDDMGSDKGMMTTLLYVLIVVMAFVFAVTISNTIVRSADKNPNPDKLYGRILVAAIWIAAIPVLGKYLILGVSAVLIFAVNSNFLIIAAFAACMIIFVFPLFLLGTVTPSLAKYSVDSLEDSGKVVGTLGAFNTIGSIIGTFVPTFVTIPAVGTSITFLIFAGILLILGIVYFVSAGVGKRKMAVSTVCFLLCCMLGYSNSFAFWEKDLTYEGESVYNYLQVKENDENVTLSTNVLFGVQSIYMKQGGLTGMYYDYAMAAPLMMDKPQAKDCEVLILGMGTGTYATQCRKYFGNMAIEGVEIDEKITDLSREYFSLPEDVKVTTYDGRAFLNAIDKKYDVIMVDAYQDITIPFQMSSVEFFTLVKEHLTEDGVMVVNMNMRGNKEGNINEYLADTIATVFDEIYTVDVNGSTNRELFASNSNKCLEQLSEHMQAVTNEELYFMMERVSENLTPYEAGEYVMTDDKAPVELLGMQVIDDLIKEEVAYYKGIYEKDGIQGLLDAM